jgi:glycosyltransferase involved in cell wall biosynthesis
MQISLNIATYKAPEVLALALESVARQTELPRETLVLEDDESAETRAVVARFADRIPNLKHFQQADEGFRLARLRNEGLARSQGDYLIAVDGDMLLHPRFVADHRAVARPGFFVQGTRQLLSPSLSARLMSESRPPRGRERIFGREARNKSRLWGLHLAWVSCLRSLKYEKPRKISGCHQAFFREDLLRINGYDNRFEGWGEEDQDLARRLFASGVREYHLRYRAVAWHLYHPFRTRENQPVGEPEATVCKDGLAQLDLPARQSAALA